MNNSRALIVDQDPEWKRILQSYLTELDVQVRFIGAAEEVLLSPNFDTPGCLLLGFECLPENLDSLISEIRQNRPFLSIIVLCADADVPSAVAAMKCGVADFLQKPADKETVLQSVSVALDRHDRLRKHWKVPASPVELLQILTTKELDVIQLLLQGKKIRTIANQLEISARTVQLRRAKAMEKLGVRTRAEMFKMVSTLESTLGMSLANPDDLNPGLRRPA